MRASTLATIAREAESPDAIARRTWMSTAFPDHPYGRPTRGTKESVSSLAVGDMQAVLRERAGARQSGHRRRRRHHARRTSAALLDRAFGDLPAKAAPNDVPDVKPQGAGRTLVVRRPVPQSVIMLGEPGVKRDDPDWFAASIVNYVLGGGGFNSRLMEEVREKRGLTYGIYTYARHLRSRRHDPRQQLDRERARGSCARSHARSLARHV